MSPTNILARLWSVGITVRLSADQQNLVVPAGRLTPEQRSLVLDHKPVLIQFLIDAHATTERLLRAAMKRCDQHNDGPVAKREMRDQCLALPPHLQSDLLEHFQGKQAFDAEQHDGSAP